MIPTRWRSRGIAAILLVGGALAFFGAWGYYAQHLGYDVSPSGDDWGTFGNFIGGFAGTAVAFVTLAAVAYNIVLQSEELHNANEHMRNQSNVLAQQAFDSVFFQLLKAFSDVRDGVTHSNKHAAFTNDRGIHEETTKSSGRDAFHKFWERLSGQCGRTQPEVNRKEHLRNSFVAVYDDYESELGPYFRTLYHVFKFIDLHPGLTDQQRVNYANIARAQLSNIELCILFYDGLTEMADEFKPLIERYGLLKHLNGDTLAYSSDIDDPSLYSPTAFMSQTRRAQAEK